MGRGGHGARGLSMPDRPPSVLVPPSQAWGVALCLLAAAEVAAVTVLWAKASRTRGHVVDSMKLKWVSGPSNSTFEVVAGAWARAVCIAALVVATCRRRSREPAEEDGEKEGGEGAPLVEQEGAPPKPDGYFAQKWGTAARFAAWFVPLPLLSTKLLVYDAWDDQPKGGALIITSFVCSFITAAALPRLLGGEKDVGIRMRTLWRILRPYFLPRGCANATRAISTWFILGASKGANLVAPLVIGEVVSRLTKNEKPYDMLWLYAGLSLGSKLLKELQGVIYIYVKQTAYIQMSEVTFRHLHGLSLEWHLKKKMGNVMRSMDRGTQAADTVVTYLFLYLVPTIVECIITFIIFYKHFGQPALAGVCFCAFVVYIWLTCAMTAWRRKFREGMNKHDNEYHDAATDSLINFETVKYFTAEDFECSRFMKGITSFQKFSVKTQATLSLLNGSQQVIIYACVISGLIIAAHAVLHDPTFHVGNFVSVQVYIMQMFTPLSFLGTIYNAVIMAFINMQNLADLLSEEPDVCDKDGAPALGLPYDVSVGEGGARGVSVEFRNVSFKYPKQGTGKGLKGVSLHAQPGQKVAIVGPTGSGKTTMVRLLFRFYDVTSGGVLVNGQNVRNVQQRSLRRAIGIVPQDTVLFNDTLKHNVLYGRPGADWADVTRAAEQAQLSEYIAGLPDGWDTKVGERGLKLSGGEKQRVAIARCLLKDPPIICLDEATSALDSQTEAQILDVLRCLGGRTIIAIAHRLSTIHDSDAIFVLKDGAVVERGTHGFLREQGGLYDQLWSKQESELKKGAVAPPVEGGMGEAAQSLDGRMEG